MDWLSWQDLSGKGITKKSLSAFMHRCRLSQLTTRSWKMRATSRSYRLSVGGLTLVAWRHLKVLPQDDNDNLVLGKAIAIDTQGCTLIAENDHMVATIGLTDMVVVHTDDATLVVPKNRAQDVREIVSLLEENR